MEKQQRRRSSRRSRSADQPAEGALQSQQTVAERNLIPAINEPLCFLTNKMGTMPADILMKLCHDFYDDDQIDGAKQLLHEVCMQMGNSLPRLIKRRGAQKKENDINDIMQVLLEIDTGHVPVFLAKDLKNLPPLSYNHFDITKVMADIELLKNEMGIARFIAQSHKDIMDAIKDLKQSDGNCDITGNDHIYTRTDETRLNAAVAPVRMNDVAGTDEVDSDNSITAVKQYMTDVPRNDEYDADGDDEGDGRVTDLVRLHAIQTETFASVAADLSHPTTGRVCNKPTMNTASQPRYGLADAPDTAREPARHRPGRVFNNSAKATFKTRSAADGTTDEVVIGASRAFRLRPSARAEKQRASRARRPVGIFVTRLHPRTTTREIDSHVRDETGCKVNSEQLATKYDTYASFFIRCHDDLAAKLLRSQVWPKGVMVKYFFEQV